MGQQPRRWLISPHTLGLRCCLTQSAPAGLPAVADGQSPQQQPASRPRNLPAGPTALVLPKFPLAFHPLCRLAAGAAMGAAAMHHHRKHKHEKEVSLLLLNAGSERAVAFMSVGLLTSHPPPAQAGLAAAAPPTQAATAPGGGVPAAGAMPVGDNMPAGHGTTVTSTTTAGRMP